MRQARARDLLEQVREGHDAREMTVLIHHERDPLPGPAKVFQHLLGQAVFGHLEGGDAHLETALAQSADPFLAKLSFQRIVGPPEKAPGSGRAAWRRAGCSRGAGCQ